MGKPRGPRSLTPHKRIELTSGMGVSRAATVLVGLVLCGEHIWPGKVSSQLLFVAMLCSTGLSCRGADFYRFICLAAHIRARDSR